MTPGGALPSTPALRMLRAADVPFEAHQYRYEARGGTQASARALNVAEHAVIKTLVLRDADATPLLMLMHGDREVSLKALARVVGTRSIQPCDQDEARRWTGYLFGGTSPFGTRHPLRVFLERSVCGLPRVYINGGARGLLVSLTPETLCTLLQPVLVSVATGGPDAEETRGLTSGLTSAALDTAAAALRADQVVVYPTDTLYALGAIATSDVGVQTILRLKGRLPERTLPLIAADLEQVTWLAGTLSARGSAVAAAWWPGPVTLVLDAARTLAPGVVAPDGSIAVRVPAHEGARRLAALAGEPLTSTSANRTGEPPAATAADCRHFASEVAIILDGGPAEFTQPSTIVDVRHDPIRLIREGAVPWKRVLHSSR